MGTQHGAGAAGGQPAGISSLLQQAVDWYRGDLLLWAPGPCCTFSTWRMTLAGASSVGLRVMMTCHDADCVSV
jgi:hypothetical protein